MTLTFFIPYAKGETEIKEVKRASKLTTSDNSKATFTFPSSAVTSLEILV